MKTDLEKVIEEVNINILRQINELTDEVLDDYNNGKYTKKELILFLKERNQAITSLNE